MLVSPTVLAVCRLRNYQVCPSRGLARLIQAPAFAVCLTRQLGGMTWHFD